WPRREPTAKQSIVGLRRTIGRFFQRDKGADTLDGFLLDAAFASGRAAKRTTEAEKIRLKRKQAWHIRRFKRAGKSDLQAECAPLFHETRNTVMRQMLEQPTTALFCGIQHHPVEAAFGQDRKQGKVGLLVGKQDSDEFHSRRKWGNCADAGWRLGFG